MMPASAQSGVPVRNALVVVSGQQDMMLQSMISTGGSPSSVQKALETAGLLSTFALHVSTDAYGRFELNAPLEPGTYNVTVFAPGFVASSDSMTIKASDAAK